MIPESTGRSESEATAGRLRLEDIDDRSDLGFTAADPNGDEGKGDRSTPGQGADWIAGYSAVLV